MVTLTTSEVLAVDGVPLNTYAYNISTRTGRYDVAQLATPNQSLPSAHGTLWTPRKVFDVNFIHLSLWVRGLDVNGAVPAAGYMQTFQSNMDTINRLLTKRHALLNLVQTKADGSQRQCDCERYQAITWTVDGTLPKAQTTIQLDIPDVFWRDLNQVTQTILVGASGNTLNFTNFQGATAPMADLVYSLLGPINNPTITDPLTGISVSLGANLGAGQTWVVDAGQWTSVIGAADQLAVTTHAGDATFLVLTPPTDGTTPKLVVTGTGGVTAATSLTVTGRRKYLS